MKNLLCVFALLLSLAATGLAQTNRGGISGTVTDVTGAVVPGAKVTITNAGTNQSQTLTTSSDGAFNALSLEPVVYRITVEATGFKKAVLNNVKVDTASTATANIALTPGEVANEVTVTAESPLINAERGTTSQTITERQIQDVPLNNRSVLDLAVTIPNVSGDAGSEDPEVTSGQPVPGFNLSLNGGRPGSTSMLADGVNNTGVGIGRAVVSFTPETVQEFTIQTSAYSAEFGTTGGGVINITTKSGTNSYNGVALWYHRNPLTNSRPFRVGTAPRPANNLRYNQFSGSVGGPIWLPKKIFGPAGYDGHDKTFFFFAYEPRYRKDFVTSTGLLPSAAERAGDFSNLVRTTSGFLPAAVAAKFNQTSTGPANIYQQFALTGGRLTPLAQTCTVAGATTAFFCQFPDNKIPQNMLDPTALRLLQLMPPPGEYFDDSGLVRNFLLERSVRQDEKRYTLRLDHSFTSKFKTNFRFTKTPAVGIRGAGNDVNGNTGVYSDAKQYLFTFNNIITPTLLNDLRLNYTRGNFSEDFSPEFAIKTGRSLSNEYGLPSLTKGGLPLFFLTQDNGYVNADLGAGGSTNNFNVEERFNLNDVVYWTRGNKTWKFGVDLDHALLNVTPFFAASGGRWQFRTVNTSNNRGTGLPNGGNDLASFLLGVPNAVDVRPLLLDYNYRWNSGAAFIQNDWKVRPNLSLNLGMRYSLQYPRAEKNNLQGVFRPDLTQTITLTETQRRAIASGTGGLGILATDPIPSFVPTNVQIPAFAFAGQGGRSKYVTPVDYWGLEPRFGFAWSPKLRWVQERHLVVRGGYGLSHAPLTGNNRNPSPDFGGFTTVGTTLTGSSGTADATLPVRLSFNQPLQGTGTPLNTLLGTNADGIVYGNGIGVPGFANDFSNGKVPYAQNWNLAFQFEVLKNTSVEVAYVGNKGTHLYLPLVNLNPRNLDFVNFLEANNIPAEGTLADPLGRRNLLGAVVTIQRSSIATPYFGFNELNRYFDPSANSIRHAVYVDVRRRVRNGLTLTANYTFGKSIDDASDANPDVRVLTTGTTRGQVSYGAPRKGDRSISTFDLKHNASSTFIYDLPFGKGRKLLAGAPSVVNAVVGGWTTSGVIRYQGGQPFIPFITDTNKLGGTNRTVRLDLVPGVPLKNPLYSPSCVIGSNCEPYINPAAFMRPVKGKLGSAPRTLDVRAPLQEYFDLSIQKNFQLPHLGEKRRVQFRVDMINVFNHPNFRYVNTGNTPPGFGTFPTEITTEAEAVTLPNGVAGTRGAVITAAEYNTWAAFNGQPLSTTTAGAAQLAAIRARVNATRLPNTVVTNAPASALPADFFHVPIPQGFATRNANSFDLNTLEGFKLYRLRQTYDPNFGTLFAVSNPRYIQFGIRIFF
ncbi:MAG: carboxypeptidase regulatory-like domain-containing protein [Acidobacteria bacterium]|nr:carboxypeptidase regulatory-like domain-containing protein [Acidobacteriota bacterium]MBI3426400.1 carboxypeptidase regulatory-like domain-containing protein [Acidobacteriota bacterium]